VFQNTTFQEIKDIAIYSKAVQEICLRKLGRKQNDPQTIHIPRKISNLMMGGVLATKYSDLGSLVVNVHINNTHISNTLIDLGVTINIMTHKTMQVLHTKFPHYQMWIYHTLVRENFS
jgi:hypothetical protein